MANETNKPVVPPRPTCIMNEEDDLRRVLALSLITAQEEEKRRKQLYGAHEPLTRRKPAGRISSPVDYAMGSQPDLTSPKTTEPIAIARPRPTAKPSTRPINKGGIDLQGPPPKPQKSNAPVVPPRPTSRRSPPKLPNFPPSSASLDSIDCAVKLRGHSSREQMLIKLSPPDKSRSELIDFDINALDPLKQDLGDGRFKERKYSDPGSACLVMQNRAYGMKDSFPKAADVANARQPPPLVPRQQSPSIPAAAPKTSASPEKNLMEFHDSMSTSDFFNLESFDPLFSEDVEDEHLDSTDSLQLFPNPFDKFKRKETPNPFPSINPISTQSLLRGSPAAEVTSNDNSDVEPEQSQPSADSGDKRMSRMAEPSPDILLQDPFSVSHLTVALEHKRRKHAKDQESRHTLKRKEKSSSPEEEVKEEPKKGHSRKLSMGTSYIAKGQESSYESLLEVPEAADDEIRSFCQIVARIKQQHHHDDSTTNTGLVISARRCHVAYSNMTVKLIVHARFIVEPIIFTCDLNSSVEHVISHVLLSITDDLGSTSTDVYIIKVFGLSEYFLNKSTLGDYEYVQECLKLDKDIKLVLQDLGNVNFAFKRYAEDAKLPVFVPKPVEPDNKSLKVTREKVNILMETYYNEVEKLRDQAMQVGCHKLQCRSVIQSVKALCSVLYKIETVDVIKAVKRLQGVSMEKGLTPSSPSDRNAFVYVGDNGDAVMSVVDNSTGRRVSRSYDRGLDDLHQALEELTKTVKCMIELYCRTFHTDFRFESTTNVVRETKEVVDIEECLIVHIATAHRVPLNIKSMYEEFKVICGLYYGGSKLGPQVATQTKAIPTGGFQDTIVWDEWVMFDCMTLCTLPREARLCFTLVGVKQMPQGDSKILVNESLGWVAMQVFNHHFELVQGNQLLGLWPVDKANPVGTTISNTEDLNSILLQVNLPEFDFDIAFPSIPEALPSLEQDFSALHPNDQEELQELLEKTSVTRLKPEESELLWEKRHYLYHKAEALPKVILAIPGWSYGFLRETYTMVQDWSPLSPTQALGLLLPQFPDTYVRSKAMQWIKSLGDDDYCDYLPQLVQALKFESYHTSALVKSLLERSASSVRVAHTLYWLLKEAADDGRYKKRYQLVFGALLSVVGEKMREELTKQEDLVKMLSSIAEKVKAAKDKDAVLQRELGNMFDFLQHEAVRLPLNLGMEIVGVDYKSCSYFTSFTFPLKIVFSNVDSKAGSLYAMFKVGDDLRQDMLTMQLIRIMDKLWLREGLDLRMITFRCQATGFKKGIVELVMEAETLRKIQLKHGHGLTGSFKNTPIAEWMQVQNPTELEHKKSVDNFTASCAGYCVATYLLGICDRHNDNIMIKDTGHMFHIDFGKFLGDSQMFGNIKRDRVPFVLTSDMAYVINGGHKPSHKFQHFVDLCCQALNIIRKHGNFLFSLFSLMDLSGIPGMGEGATKYLQKALLPEQSDAEATAAFTRMINESLKSTFTQLNFFFHNLAQMKFSGHTEGALLSFIPKTYSLQTDGRITGLEIFGYQKRYNPEKYYIYIIKVDRENQKVPSFVFRRYSEFQELHDKLVMMFPLVKLPSFSVKVILGRTHVKNIAEARKLELETFLKELLELAPEISEHDLFYTFFHPMLRDEQDIDKTNLQKIKAPASPKLQNRKVEGRIKLSIFYKNYALTVMVNHVKDLVGLGSEAPDPYVKLYLLPDPSKLSKRKTKIAKNTFHPTYNEMLIYRMPLEVVTARTLQATVWNFNSAMENEFLGATHIRLSDLGDLSDETGHWYTLQTLTNTAGS